MVEIIDKGRAIKGFTEGTDLQQFCTFAERLGVRCVALLHQPARPIETVVEARPAPVGNRERIRLNLIQFGHSLMKRCVFRQRCSNYKGI
ncbi:hypothetical protein D3C86_1118930 [compost metagenome]